MPKQNDNKRTRQRWVEMGETKHTCPQRFTAQKWCSPLSRFRFFPSLLTGSYSSSLSHAGHTTTVSSPVSLVNPSLASGTSILLPTPRCGAGGGGGGTGSKACVW